MEKTLEELLRTPAKMNNGVKFIPDFRVSVQSETPDGTKFMIHPFGHAGDTLTFRVKGNKLKQIREL